jgi:hypothetical protein
MGKLWRVDKVLEDSKGLGGFAVRRLAPPALQSKEGAEFLGIDFLKPS